MEKELQETFLTYYSLMIAQELWQAHYQILPIIVLKEFIELNINSNMTIKKCETCGINYNYCDCYAYTNFKDNLIECKCFSHKKNYQHKFDVKLKEWFFKTSVFSYRDNNKFILLLWKGVYPYEYLDDWKTSVKHCYLKKKILQSLKYGRYYQCRLHSPKKSL